MEEAFEGTLEDVNEAIVEIANDFNDFAGEFSFSDLLDVGKTVGETLEMVGTKLNGMKEAEMEEMVEEVKPRLRRETFENSFLLSRVGGRQFLLVLLIIAQVMMQTEMLMLMFMLTMEILLELMLSIKMIVILLMLGLLFFLGGAPPASPKHVPVADPGMDWLRLIQTTTHLDHQYGLCQVAVEPVGGVHHPPPHLASC